mmetsp:Transcript_27781/g.65965  ORF Transcript_27781/g.65965 Transcript_27781/m.65965 type:complete len:216 (-) Transcript_27781:274-921(-)
MEHAHLVLPCHLPLVLWQLRYLLTDLCHLFAGCAGKLHRGWGQGPSGRSRDARPARDREALLGMQKAQSEKLALLAVDRLPTGAFGALRFGSTAFGRLGLGWLGQLCRHLLLPGRFGGCGSPLQSRMASRLVAWLRFCCCFLVRQHSALVLTLGPHCSGRGRHIDICIFRSPGSRHARQLGPLASLPFVGCRFGLAARARCLLELFQLLLWNWTI